MSAPFPLASLPADFYTPNRIIRFARQDAGLLQTGGTINSEDLTDGMNRLNEMILYRQTKGLKLWLQFLQPVTLVNGQQVYVFGPGGDVPFNKPTRIISGYFQDQNGNQRPLIELAWDDWNKLSNKNQQGDINSYFVDKQAFVLRVSYWLIPNVLAALGTAQMLVQQQQPTVVSLTDTMVFPPEWGMWLHWGLADQISTGQPQAIMDRCEKRATEALETLADWDVEDAPTSFAPDLRGPQNFGSFR
jgi:hypothetical protein